MRLPGSATPVSASVALLVNSASGVPLSTSAVTALGAVWSMVKAKALVMPLALPAKSAALAKRVWLPAAMASDPKSNCH